MDREIRDELEKTQMQLREARTELEAARAALVRPAPPELVAPQLMAGAQLAAVRAELDRARAELAEVDPPASRSSALVSLICGLGLTIAGVMGLLGDGLSLCDLIGSLAVGPPLIWYAWRLWKQ